MIFKTSWGVFPNGWSQNVKGVSVGSGGRDRTFQVFIQKTEEKWFWKHQPQGHCIQKLSEPHVIGKKRCQWKLDRKKSWLLLVKGIDFRKNFACVRMSERAQQGISWLTEPLGDLTIHHKVNVNFLYGSAFCQLTFKFRDSTLLPKYHRLTLSNHSSSLDSSSKICSSTFEWIPSIL